MSRLYIAPLDVHMAHRDIRPPSMTYWMALYIPDPDETAAQAWEKSGKHVAIIMSFQYERHQDLWESHPLVTVLPHPVYEPSTPVSGVRTMPENLGNVSYGSVASQDGSLPVGFRGVSAPRDASGWVSSQVGEQKANISHPDGVSHLLGARFGVVETDTVAQVHAKLAVMHPAFKLRRPR